ncbi:MAG: hypothetical protein FWH11_06760 [Micrococcales bacterium]|nr:hypothetical protein [Micrococcales bacterium]
MDAMTALARRRIHVTDTPDISAMIGRNARPGEPRAATLVRLAQRGDQAEEPDQPFMLFSTGGRTITDADLEAALYDEDPA